MWTPWRNSTGWWSGRAGKDLSSLLPASSCTAQCMEVTLLGASCQGTGGWHTTGLPGNNSVKSKFGHRPVQLRSSNMEVVSLKWPLRCQPSAGSSGSHLQNLKSIQAPRRSLLCIPASTWTTHRAWGPNEQWWRVRALEAGCDQILALPCPSV
jgi:hypothetical protein